MNPSSIALNWNPFENIPCGPRAASVAASCEFSLCTLEVASIADADGFVLTERKQPDVWRWAVIRANGVLLEEGFEPTQMDAKRAAAEALKLVDVQCLT
jgi:hypothetical protein